MDHLEAGRYWNENAEVWTQLARTGSDVYRDHLNTPAFFEMLSPVNGLKGIDIGCGEGHNTRLLAQKGASMQAIDISEIFIKHAKAEEERSPLQIEYCTASAVILPFEDNTFDFATGFMSFMDIPETDKVFIEAFRVIKEGGFLQFSILHPCFHTAHRKNIKHFNGKTYAIQIGDYFKNKEGEIDEWIFGSAPPHLKHNLRKFTTPIFTRTLSQWINIIIEAGFTIEKIGEPSASDEVLKKFPQLHDTQITAYFLHIRCRKPIC